MKHLLSKLPSPISHFLQKATLLLFAYMPFHIFLSQWLSTLTGGLDVWKLWKDFFTVLLTILFIVTVFILKKQTKLYRYLLGLTAVYGLIHLILLFATDQPLGTGLLASAYNLRIFAYVIIGYSLALIVPKTDHAKRFAKILIILSTIVCMIALLQWILPKDIMANFGYSLERGVKPNFFIDDKPDLPRVFSTLRDPNSLGAFLILPIVLLSQKLVKNWKTQRRMFLSGLLLLHVLILLLTFSRSTLLATILALTVLMSFHNSNIIKKHLRKILIGLGASLLVLFGVFTFLKDTYVVQNLVFHADESTVLADPNELRVELVQKGIDGVIDQPFGNGPGTAGLVSTRLPDGLLTENYFLQIAYEVGVFGFIVFATLLYMIVKNLWEKRKEPLVRVLLASFVGLVFANLLFHTWANEAVAISWFMLTGIALAADKKVTGIIAHRLSKKDKITHG